MSDSPKCKKCGNVIDTKEREDQMLVLARVEGYCKGCYIERMQAS